MSIKALLLGEYCIITIIFWIKLFLPALFPFYSSIYFRERFLVAVLVEIWFTCFNSVGKTSILRKSLFFFPVPLPVTLFYTLYSSTQCLLFESCKNRVKQVGLRALSAWQTSGWQGRTGCWDSKFLAAVARGCCTGDAGHGHGPSTLGHRFHVVSEGRNDCRQTLNPSAHLKTCLVCVYAYTENT